MRNRWFELIIIADGFTLVTLIGPIIGLVGWPSRLSA
jgi:hypothetical protein